MTDASAPAPELAPAHETLGHDGMSSRTWLTALGVFVAVFGAACAFLAFGKISAEQWQTTAEYISGFAVFGYSGANVAQRAMAALAVRGQ